MLKIDFIMVTQLSNGKISHIFLNAVPNNSFEKYIPLVKHTSWTIILDMPDAAFSVNILPINIPNAINKIAITIDINIIISFATRYKY